MGAIRKCCGFYCAFIMFIGIFFYIITIILELSKNQFMLNHLHETPVQGEEDARWSFSHDGFPSVQQQQADTVMQKVASMGIAIGVSTYQALYSIDQLCVHILLHFLRKVRR